MCLRSYSAFLAGAVTFASLPLVSVVAAPAVAKENATPAKTFIVGGRQFRGTAKTICVIEGKWANGEYFRYEAWDSCAEMSMRRTSHAEFKTEESYGNEDDPKISDIPAKSEVIEMSNGSSSVLLFRDRGGVMREITISD